jgi:CRP-like cAMP-binding protein
VDVRPTSTSTSPRSNSPTITTSTFLQRIGPGREAELRTLGVRRRFPASSTLFFEADTAHEALIMLGGAVKVVICAADGREVILDVLTEGALVGELSAVDGQPRSATAITLDPVEVLAVPCSAFVDFLHRHPAVMYQLLVGVAARLRNSDLRQLELGTGDALGRICARLLTLMERYGQPARSDGTVEVRSPLSQADLASWTGLSREAVVKAMRTLRQLGWISNRGPDITILRLDQVRERAST